MVSGTTGVSPEGGMKIEKPSVSLQVYEPQGWVVAALPDSLQTILILGVMPGVAIIGTLNGIINTGGIVPKGVEINPSSSPGSVMSPSLFQLLCTWRAVFHHLF